MYFWYWFVPICAIIICYTLYDMFSYDRRKPIYRLEKKWVCTILLSQIFIMA